MEIGLEKMDNRIKDCIDKSVLCWLATVDGDHAPNVSPKEVFAFYNEKTLLIANIASPGSVRNIRNNPNVCVSLVDIVIEITVVKAPPILAPSYLFFPDTTESKQIENAMGTYGVRPR